MSNVIEGRERSTIGVIVDRELRERLEAAAAANERSLGAEVRYLLREYLDRADQKEDE